MDLEDDFIGNGVVSSLTTIGIVVLMMGLFAYSLMNLDSFKRQKIQENLQQGLTRALVGYTTTYDESLDNYSNISEGYILMEDITIYNKASNSLQLDRNKASDIFFRCLDASTKIDLNYMKSFGVFLVDIITETDAYGTDKYSLAIYRNGTTLVALKEGITSLEGVSNFIEETLDVSLDIATGFNASIRKAQAYSESRTTNGNQVFTHYTTSMAILKDIPIYGVFGKTYQDIYELQTYSLGRKDS